MSINLAESYREIVLQLYVLLEVTRSACHSETERRDAAECLERACRDVLQERGSLILGGRGAGLLVNGVRACFDLQAFAAVEGVRHCLRQCHVQEIVIQRCVSAGELLALATLMSDPEPAVVPGYFETQLALTSLHVSASSMTVEDNADGAESSSALQSVYVAKQLIDCALADTEVAPKYAQETLKGIVDLVLEDGSLLNLLTDLQGLGPDVMRASAQTCLLSVILGRRIGLPEVTLGELGVAALFYPLLRDGSVEDLLGDLLVLKPTTFTLRVIHMVCHRDVEATDDDVIGMHGLDGGLIPTIVKIAGARASERAANEGHPIEGVPLCLVDAFAETVAAAQAVGA